MGWHVVSVTSGFELKTAARISAAGFITHCPVWTRKIRRPQREGIFFRSKIEPLFRSYLFVKEDEAFRKDKFESEKIRLTVFRKELLTDMQMADVKLIETQVAMEQMKAKHGLKVEVGEVLQIIHGVMAGEPVQVSRVGKDRVLVQLTRLDGSVPVWINTTSLSKAV